MTFLKPVLPLLSCTQLACVCCLSLCLCAHFEGGRLREVRVAWKGSGRTFMMPIHFQLVAVATGVIIPELEVFHAHN